MSQKKCCFIGQNELDANIGEMLDNVVEAYIEKHGVTEFKVGKNGLFDLLAGCAVGVSKLRHRGVKMYLMQPKREHGKPLPNMEDFDDVIYPEGLKDLPSDEAALRLYQLMLQDADHVIAYVTQSEGPAAAALEQARELEKQGKLIIINLGDYSKYLKSETLY